MNNLQRRGLRVILILVIMACYFFALISVNKNEESIFTVWENVTFEHTIYEQVKAGDSLDEILNTVVDNNVEIKLKDNILTVNKISLDVSDKSNIKIVNEHIEEAFSTIDDKIIDKNMVIKSEISSPSDYDILKYENQEFFIKNDDIITITILCIISVIYLIFSIIAVGGKFFRNLFENCDFFFIIMIIILLVISSIAILL